MSPRRDTHPQRDEFRTNDLTFILPRTTSLENLVQPLGPQQPLDGGPHHHRRRTNLSNTPSGNTSPLLSDRKDEAKQLVDEVLKRKPDHESAKTRNEKWVG